MTEKTQLNLLLVCLLLSNLILAGCSSSPPNLSEKNLSDFNDLNKFMAVMAISSLYMAVKGNSPDSIEDIENFCSDYNSPNCGIDLKKFDLQQLENGKVRIKYKSDMFSATMEIDNIAQSSSDVNSIPKKDIEEIIKHLTK
jgi:hypothetical protein